MSRLLTGVIAILIAGIPLSACKHTTQTASRPEKAKPKAQVIEVVTLQRQNLQNIRKLPGRLLAFESTDIYPKASGFISNIFVDRGSVVHQGQVLATLTAPELSNQLQEAQSKAVAAQSQIAEAQAKYEADESNYLRLKAAAKTTGVIAPIELITAQKTAEASLERAKGLKGEKMAALAAAKTVNSNRSYLQVIAPFSGIITTRNLHPGALVGPVGSGNSVPIFRLEQIAHLRLIVSIPEADVSGLHLGLRVEFTVPAYPENHFTAKVSRLSHALDEQTRTEPVELDIDNHSNQLDPGMYAEVLWPVRHSQPTFTVPNTAVVTTTERTFVIRIKQGVTEWVDVHPGNTIGTQMEIFGALNSGDQIVANATDELRTGIKVNTRLFEVKSQ